MQAPLPRIQKGWQTGLSSCAIMDLKKYTNLIIGYNNRMDELQAAILRVRLQYLSADNAKRNDIARLYQQQLKQQPNIILPHVHPKASSVFHLL